MSKDSINERFIEAVKHLKTSGVIKKYTDLANNLGCSPQIITEILGKRMSVQIELLQNFFDVYNISHDFIFKGILPIIDASLIPNKVSCEKCVEKDVIISNLKESIIDLQKDLINSYKEKIIDESASDKFNKDGIRQTA